MGSLFIASPGLEFTRDAKRLSGSDWTKAVQLHAKICPEAICVQRVTSLSQSHSGSSDLTDPRQKVLHESHILQTAAVTDGLTLHVAVTNCFIKHGH